MSFLQPIRELFESLEGFLLVVGIGIDGCGIGIPIVAIVVEAVIVTIAGVVNASNGCVFAFSYGDEFFEFLVRAIINNMRSKVGG